MKILASLLLVCAPASALLSCRSADASEPTHEPLAESPDRKPTMELGAFSVSLAVKDLPASRDFYQKLGFEPVGGDPSQNWLILRNGTTTIGLFQGMFPANILTFNPGWDAQAEPVGEFTDVRELQRRMKEAGLELQTEADESTEGPASCILVDPDGNTILIDQHV